MSLNSWRGGGWRCCFRQYPLKPLKSLNQRWWTAIVTHRSLGTGILVPGIVQNESTFNPHSLFQLRSPSLLSGAAPQNSPPGSCRGQTHPGTVFLGSQFGISATHGHMSSPHVINAIQPPWGLICTTLSHKSGTLRACQQLIDIQEQFPCPHTKSCERRTCFNSMVKSVKAQELEPT